MNKLSLLIVEDDQAVRSLIASTLQLHGYTFHLAKNGTQALMEATLYVPDIMLLDLGLPDIDGVDIIKKVRTWSTLPIIVISARSEDKDKIDALDAGADDYITKPFSVDELLARIRALQYTRVANPQDATFKNGDLTIDYEAGCVYCRGQEIHLTPIEYKLLCLLSKNVGKVLTHTILRGKSRATPGIAIWHPCGSIWQRSARKSKKIRLILNLFKPILVLAIA